MIEVTLEEALELLWNDTGIARDSFDALSANIKADAQALADVRTLDEWRADNYARMWRMCAGPYHGCRLTDAMLEHVFDGSTPEAVRAKAAAWVREQAKGAKADG